jgi:ABC-type transport system substrate-binding protein
MSIDPKVRQDLYAQAQKIIMDDAPWIFMYIEKFTLAWRKPLKGVIVFPFETFDITYAKFEQ